METNTQTATKQLTTQQLLRKYVPLPISDLTNLPDPELAAIPEGPHKLLTAVSNLQTRRLVLLQDRQRAANRAKEAAEDALEKELLSEESLKEFWEGVEELRREKREWEAEERRRLREDEWEEREVKRREKVREKRVKRVKRLEEMSGEELFQKIEDVVGAEMENGRLGYKEGEDVFALTDRLNNLRHAASQIYKVEFRRLMVGNVRYFEGIPLNVKYTGPCIPGMLVPFPRISSDHDACLNCQVKGLPCTYTCKQVWKDEALMKGCRRCLRSGDDCMVKWAGHPGRKEYWVFPNNEGRRSEEERVEVVERLWELREEMRGGKRRALPRWHGNDDDENKADPDYQNKVWWQQLRDRTTKW